MMDPVDTRFFTALQQVLRDLHGAEAATCRAAVDRALESGMPLDLRAAREHLESLTPDLRGRIFALVHTRMASDLSAIWDLLPYASGTQRAS